MSEQKPIYNLGNGLPSALDGFKNRPCALPFSNENFTQPTPEEVARLIELAGWSQNDTARLTGVSWNPKKGSSTVRRWKAPEGKPDSREIPYSSWRLLLLYSGVVDVNGDLAILNQKM